LKRNKTKIVKFHPFVSKMSISFHFKNMKCGYPHFIVKVATMSLRGVLSKRLKSI